MKKILFSCLMAYGIYAQAQVGPPTSVNPNATPQGYGFTQSNGTYTVLDASKTIWQSGVTLATDGVSSAITIPAFNFNGKTYTSLFISNNGFVTFGKAPLPGTYPGLSTNTTTTDNYAEGAIAGFAANLVNANTTTSEIAYQQVGSKFIIQFTDLKASGGSTAQLINFQIQLDTTNNTIAMVYGNCVSGSATITGQIGLRGTDGGELNNRTGANWTATTAGTSNSSTCTLGTTNATTVPVSGLTFLYSPGTWLATPTTYATLPFTENFSTWVNGNSTADLPNATYWRSWPSRGNASWRANNIGTTGFTSANGWGSTSGAPAVGGSAVAPFARFHSFNSPINVVGYMDLYVDLSTGGVGNRNISFDYINTDGTDKLELQLSTDGGATFTSLGSPLGISTSWTNKSFSVTSTASNAILRLKAISDFGSTDIGVDNFNITVSVLPPACVTISTPANAATGVSTTPVITWPAATGASGYNLMIGTSAGASDVLASTNVGNVTTYTLPVANVLSFATNYFVTVLPFNAFGNPTGCNSNSFTTMAIPCPTVTAPTAAATGQSLTPTITWNAVPGATSYTVTVGSSNGASDIVPGVDVGNATSYTFATPLSISTKYYYTINTIVGAQNSISCIERNFTTMCNPYTIPYFEGFESGYTQDGEVSGCLSQASVTGTNVWSANSTLTTYNRTPRSGSWNAYLRWGNERWVFVPIQLTGGMTYKFNAYARQDASATSDASITVAYGSANTAVAMTNSIVASKGITNGDYQKISGNFTPATSGVYYIGIKGNINSTPYYISLDDISIDVASSCVEPSTISSTGITTSTIGISWVAPIPVPASGYDVYYSTSSTPPIATATPNATVANTQTTYLMNGLTSNTSYFVWVRSKCSATEFSSWTGPLAQTTLCDATNVPYMMDFESTVVPNLPSCTSTQNVGTGSNWTVANNPGYGFTTKVLKYGYDEFNAANTWFFTQGINLTAGMKYNIAFSYGNGSTTFVEKLKVAYGTASNAGAMTTTIANFPNVNQGTKQNVNYNFVAPTTGVYYFGFNAYSAADQLNLFVDDINITVDTMGTEEVSTLQSGVKIYPNPFADVLNISDVKGVKNIIISDASGRMVKTINNPSNELQLGDLKTGLYMITLQYKDGSSRSIKAMKK